MKYQLVSELNGIKKWKIPATTKLLPMMNFFMKIFTCKSDTQVNVKKYEISGYQNGKISVHVIEPKQIKEKLPCMILYHGGGFMLKASDTHYQLAKDYAAQWSCKVVYADYRLAPKHPYPVPVEDCFSTYRWAIEHSDMLGIIPEKIVICGDSAGGNLAAAVTFMARDRGLQMPKGAMLIYPVTDRRMQTETMKNYVDTPVWDARLSRMMWSAYLGNTVPEPIEYASPIEAVTLAGFPETYVEVAEYDCLRDEGILFCERLKQEGIPTAFHEIKNACHGYERAIYSSLMSSCMEMRGKWINNIWMR